MKGRGGGLFVTPLQHSLSSLHFVLFFFPTMSEKSLESVSENVIVSIINQAASSLLFFCFSSSGDYFSFILLGGIGLVSSNKMNRGEIVLVLMIKMVVMPGVKL